MSTNKRALRPGGKPWQPNNTNSSSQKCQLTTTKSVRYGENSARPKTSEASALPVATGADSWFYRIPTWNLDVYRVERMFKVIGVPCTLVYGRGMEDPNPESTVTFRFAGVGRVLAESIAQMIKHLNDAAALAADHRAEGVVGSK